MGLDIWFKDDIANILRAVHEANLSALAASNCDRQAHGGGTPALQEAYREGFAAALVTVAVALGLPLPASASGVAPRGVSRIRDVTGAGVSRVVDLRRR